MMQMGMFGGSVSPAAERRALNQHILERLAEERARRREAMQRWAEINQASITQQVRENNANARQLSAQRQGDKEANLARAERRIREAEQTRQYETSRRDSNYRYETGRQDQFGRDKQNQFNVDRNRADNLEKDRQARVEREFNRPGKKRIRTGVATYRWVNNNDPEYKQEQHVETEIGKRKRKRRENKGLPRYH